MKKVGNWQILEVKNLKDIANAMNLSKSAVHKHIQEGISKIIEIYFKNEKI